MSIYRLRKYYYFTRWAIIMIIYEFYLLLMLRYLSIYFAIFDGGKASQYYIFQQHERILPIWIYILLIGFTYTYSRHDIATHSIPARQSLLYQLRASTASALFIRFTRGKCMPATIIDASFSRFIYIYCDAVARWKVLLRRPSTHFITTGMPRSSISAQ